MKKVLLFGSGDGAKRFLLKFQEKMEVIGIFDNDQNKHGKEFSNGLIIDSPLNISNYEYDELIIASQWAKEIKEQLINDLNIPSVKIIIPPKVAIKETEKPFEDEGTLILAREIIKSLSLHAYKDKIPLIVDFGTLLGIVRDGDIIPWDDDVDFSIVNLSDEIDFSTWLVKTIEKLELPVKLSIRTKVVDSKCTSFLLYFNDERYNSFLTSISLRELKNDHYIHLPSGGMWFAPKIHFETYEILNWQGIDVKVPAFYKEYLTFVYGNWQTPKKDISMDDYANLGNVDYENYQDQGIGYKEIL